MVLNLTLFLKDAQISHLGIRNKTVILQAFSNWNKSVIIYPQLELNFCWISGLGTLDGDFTTELYGHRSHQNSFAVRVRHRHEVLLAARQQRQRRGALQNGGSRVSVELRFCQNCWGNREALLTVGHEEGGHRRMVRNLIGKPNTNLLEWRSGF